MTKDRVIGCLSFVYSIDKANCEKHQWIHTARVFGRPFDGFPMAKALSNHFKQIQSFEGTSAEDAKATGKMKKL